MERTTPIFDIHERTFRYAMDAIGVYTELQSQRNSAGWIIGKQLLRSATSIGANMEEAKAAETRADFIHKCSISQKEARESLYWLRLLSASGILEELRLAPLINETHEIVAILTAIGKNARQNMNRKQ